MRQEHASASRNFTGQRDGSFGRNTARLAAFTALGVAAGTLIGAAAMVHIGERDGDVALAAASQPSAAITAAAVSGPTTDLLPVEAQAEEPASETAQTEPAPIAVPAAETEVAAAEQPLEAEAPAAAPVIDEPLAARFGDVAEPVIDVPAQESPSLADATAEATLPAASDAGLETTVPGTPVTAPEIEVEVASTEAEVLAIEERLSAAGSAYFQLPPATEDPFEAALSEEIPLPTAQVNAWVNMRAGPDNDAEILAVVPGGAEIGAEADCLHWCEVVYEGQQGFIYSSFIRR